MTTKISKVMVLILSVLVLAATPAFSETKPGNGHEHEKHEHEGHVAPHGGVLNEIEGCAIGHAEARMTGDMLEIWFLDGGNETGRAIQIADERIPLSILISKNERIEMNLVAEPLKLAGEKLGKCSHYVGKSEALKALTHFEGYGWLRFKGQVRPLRISQPEGFEGDDEHVHGDDASHKH